MNWLKDFGGDIISGAASLLGGGIKAITGKQAGDREYARQKEFAQNGIRWRVEDAKAAGIHPIYAVGANVSTYSPQAAVGSDFGLSSFGQNIGRAIEAKQTHEERMAGQRLNNMVGQAQARYYEAAANNQQAQADLAGQRAVTEALNDISGRGFIADMDLSSRNRLRNQPAQPPVMPHTQEVSTYNKPKPGIDPYIIGNTYFEAPPENIADMVENPALFAGWKGVIETAQVLDGKVKQDFMKILMPSHRKLVASGTHEIIRVPGIGFSVKRKGDPLKPSDFGLDKRGQLFHHTGGPLNIN